MEIIIAAAAGVALGLAGLFGGRWFWPRKVAIPAFEEKQPRFHEEPPPCKSQGHIPGSTGARFVNGEKRREMFCARCGKEWLA